MKELEPNILEDFEHRVNLTIERHHDEAGFPQMSDYKVTREELDDYLFDYQAILDSEGTLRAQQTLYGIITVMPVIVLSAFPHDSLTQYSSLTYILMALGVGITIALAIKLVRTWLKKSRLQRLRGERIALTQYVDAVIAFDEKK